MRKSRSKPADTRDRCFAPVAGEDAETLILGSLPGRKSLAEQQYYAHPRNAFWTLMAVIFEADPTADYEERKRLLIRNRIALWDVFAAAERPGSLDSAIVHDTAEANDFREFLRAHPQIRRVFFNGRKSEEIFRRRVLPRIGTEFPGLRYAGLPSTSPAHAGMDFAGKLARWRAIRDQRAGTGLTAHTHARSRRPSGAGRSRRRRPSARPSRRPPRC